MICRSIGSWIESEKIKGVIAKYEEDREKELRRHDEEMDALKQERLDSVSWREKNDLTAQMLGKVTFDLGRYLDLYTVKDNPYFGVVGIHDLDPNIGMKEYLIGK